MSREYHHELTAALDGEEDDTDRTAAEDDAAIDADLVAYLVDLAAAPPAAAASKDDDYAAAPIANPLVAAMEEMGLGDATRRHSVAELIALARATSPSRRPNRLAPASFYSQRGGASPTRAASVAFAHEPTHDDGRPDPSASNETSPGGPSRRPPSRQSSQSQSLAVPPNPRHEPFNSGDHNGDHDGDDDDGAKRNGGQSRRKTALYGKATASKTIASSASGQQHRAALAAMGDPAHLDGWIAATAHGIADPPMLSSGVARVHHGEDSAPSRRANTNSGVHSRAIDADLVALRAARKAGRDSVVDVDAMIDRLSPWHSPSSRPPSSQSPLVPWSMPKSLRAGRPTSVSSVQSTLRSSERLNFTAPRSLWCPPSPTVASPSTAPTAASTVMTPSGRPPPRATRSGSRSLSCGSSRPAQPSMDAERHMARAIASRTSVGPLYAASRLRLPSVAQCMVLVDALDVQHRTLY